MPLQRICHVCLEEDTIEDTVGDGIKDCCDAYICRDCWDRWIIDHNECMICKSTIIPIIDEEDDGMNDNELEGIVINEGVVEVCEYRESLRKLGIILKWVIIGYASTNIIVLVILQDVDKYWESIQFLNTNLYFWPLCISYGYLIVSMYECYSNNTCQNWA
tara:strand:+ start:540 stop:1022 length:483 start_codon:yes stop_codon:yes gene_type:complete